MANHKSAKKRSSTESKLKSAVNRQYLTKIRSNLNVFQ